jgi:hypothetical protein
MFTNFKVKLWIYIEVTLLQIKAQLYFLSYNRLSIELLLKTLILMSLFVHVDTKFCNAVMSKK